MLSPEWRAVALVIGTQIGAGVLSLPFAIKSLGMFWGSLAVFFAGLLMLLSALFLLEALYRTNPNFHLFELIEHHFGVLGAMSFLLIMLFAVYGAISAYLDGMVQALTSFVPVPPFWLSLLLWAFIALIVYKGLRLSSTVEAATVTLMIMLFVLTVLWSLPYFKPYLAPLSPDAFFTAFTVSIFAFFAHLIIPEVTKTVRSKRLAVQVLIKSFTITTLVYILFAIAVIGVLGENTPEISVFGLVNVFGDAFAPLAYLIPLFTMFTSSIGVGLGMVDMTKEYVRRRSLALLAVFLPPLVLHLLGLGFFKSLILGSLALLLAGGIIPSLLILKMKKERLIPFRLWIGLATLTIFLFVLFWELMSFLLA